jgi:flagellar basal body-associated protein FliL
MAQEAVVRAVVTDELTDATAEQLIDRDGRSKLQERILKEIGKKTDVHAEEVLFTDVTVQ